MQAYDATNDEIELFARVDSRPEDQALNGTVGPFSDLIMDGQFRVDASGQSVRYPDVEPLGPNYPCNLALFRVTSSSQMHWTMKIAGLEDDREAGRVWGDNNASGEGYVAHREDGLIRIYTGGGYLDPDGYHEQGHGQRYNTIDDNSIWDQDDFFNHHGPFGTLADLVRDPGENVYGSSYDGRLVQTGAYVEPENTYSFMSYRIMLKYMDANGIWSLPKDHYSSLGPF